MFHSEGIMFMVVLCVVNASVIVNIYDDELQEDNKVNQNIHGCNNQACNQLCRRMGFTGGVCVGSRCKCDIFLRAADLERAKLHQNVQGCDYRACDQLCRRLGFTGGACVGDRCKCDNFLSLKELEESKLHKNLLACNNRACDQLCRRLGFTGGVCVGDRCKCDNFLPHKDIDAGFKDLRCDYNECDQRCRRLVYPSGGCVNGLCKCDQFHDEDNEIPSVDEAVMEISDSYADTKDLDICITAVCDVACRSLGYPGGNCFNGKCQCQQKVNFCDPIACNFQCQDYVGGICIDDQCYCF
ncbi:tenascin-like isoform X2 [Vanessa cardui]|uniref:tenascin-like isoform X2 n=1 Tax=Vanessa cardui TaxID=171605 RepID=UPI001F12E52D|nr:tenascin-like isoform X2 [Vanessa cardui]